jgi:hypothetical protein
MEQTHFFHEATLQQVKKFVAFCSSRLFEPAFLISSGNTDQADTRAQRR